jgi:hypothetical protein
VTARRRLRRAVALSFPVAWALHDLEELLTAAAWGRTAPERIRRRFPNAPDWLLARLDVTTPQMAVAIGVVGAGVVAGARSGLRDLDGDMGALPAVLAAYTAHGATHLMQAAALRATPPASSPCRWSSRRTPCGPGARSGEPACASTAPGCAAIWPWAVRSPWDWRSAATPPGPPQSGSGARVPAVTTWAEAPPRPSRRAE